VDTSRVAIALARTRLMAARYPYFLLADSPAGARKEAELSGQTPPSLATTGDIRKGFVYKRVPHITLKAIANNAEIDVIHARWQPELERLAGELNGLLGQHWAGVGDSPCGRRCVARASHGAACGLVAGAARASAADRRQHRPRRRH
jgi:hypothetical protein